MSQPCNNCNGTGRVGDPGAAEECGMCDGTGLDLMTILQERSQNGCRVVTGHGDRCGGPPFQCSSCELVTRAYLAMKELELDQPRELPAGRFEAPADKVCLVFACDTCDLKTEWPVTSMDDGTPVCENCDTDMKIGDVVFVSDTVSEAILVGDELCCPHCKGSEFTGWNNAIQAWTYYMENGVVQMGSGDTEADSEMFLFCCGCSKNLKIPEDLEKNIHYT